MLTLQTRFKPLLLKGGGGGYNPLTEVTVNSNEETLKTFVLITSKNSASVYTGSAVFSYKAALLVSIAYRATTRH